MKSNKTRILSILVLVPCKNPPGYQEGVILFIEFSFVKSNTTIYWIENMNQCISEILKSYKEIIVSSLNNCITADLLV